MKNREEVQGAVQYLTFFGAVAGIEGAVRQANHLKDNILQHPEWRGNLPGVLDWPDHFNNVPPSISMAALVASGLAAAVGAANVWRGEPLHIKKRVAGAAFYASLGAGLVLNAAAETEPGQYVVQHTGIDRLLPGLAEPSEHDPLDVAYGGAAALMTSAALAGSLRITRVMRTQPQGAAEVLAPSQL